MSNQIITNDIQVAFLRKVLEQLKSQLTDDFMIGLYNGCELALSVAELRKPHYVTFDMILRETLNGEMVQSDEGDVFPNKAIVRNQAKVMDAFVYTSVQNNKEG